MAKTYNTYYDIPKLTVWGMKQEDGSVPRLVLSFRDGVPRLKVYYGKDKGISEYAADHLTFGCITKAIRRVATGPFGVHEAIPTYKNKYEDGKPTGEKVPGNKLVIGRSKEGIFYILIMDANKESLPIQFGQSDWHDHYGTDKEMIAKSQISGEMGEYFANLLDAIIADMLVVYAKDSYEQGEYKPMVIEPYDPSKPRASKFKSGGQNTAPKSQLPAAPTSMDNFDDDIPF